MLASCLRARRAARLLLLACFLLPATGSPQSLAGAERFGSFGMKVPKVPGALNYHVGSAVNPSTNEVFVLETFRVQVFSLQGSFRREWSCPDCGGIAVNPNTSDVYVTRYLHNRVIRYNSAGVTLGTWGELGSGPGQFNSPWGIAVDPETGNVYVRDTVNARVQQFTATGTFIRSMTPSPGWFVAVSSPAGLAFDANARMLYTTDPFARSISKFDADGTYQYSWTGTLGSGPGQLKWIRGIGVDPFGNVYVCDTDNERISVFAPNSVFLKSFQGPHSVSAGPFHPRDISIHPVTGAKFVNAAYAFRMDRFDGSDAFLGSFGSRQKDGVFLEDPRGIAVSPLTGDVYLIDSVNMLVKRFSPGGGFKTQWGGSVRIDPGLPGLLGFYGDSAITVDPDGNVWKGGPNGLHYADEPLNLFVQQADPNGATLAAWPRVDQVGVKYDEFIRAIAVDPVSREVWLADWAFNRVRKYTPTGLPLLSLVMSRPSGLAVRDGLVYVGEQGQQRIQVFTTGGGFVRTFGSAGSGPGELNLVETSGIAIAPDGSVVVADSGNHRIQQFTPEGTFLAEINPGRGSLPAEFVFPFGVAFSPSGNVLYVLDSINDRVQLFCLAPVSVCLNAIHSDGDPFADFADNCPFVGNAGQANSGRVATPADPTGTTPDTIGDACQCGEVTGDGIVDGDDWVAIREYLAGGTTPIPIQRCSVSGEESCDLKDLAILVRARAGRGPGVTQLCPAALRVLP